MDMDDLLRRILECERMIQEVDNDTARANYTTIKARYVSELR
jgi:hypothetical protein